MLLASVIQRARFVASIFCLSLMLALAAVSAAAQSLTFSGRQIQTGGQYQTTADFNADGRADIATAGLDVEILLGNGNGTFQPNVKYGIGTTLTGITTGDFNNDAKLDLAVSINDTVEVGVLLGRGDGTFSQANRFSTGATGSPTSIVAADFNLDGRLDLMTSDPIYCRTAPCFLTKTATVLLGNGDGTFQTPRQFDTVTPVHRFDVGDFNRDGATDVIGAAAFGKVLILLSNGDGTFRQMPDVLVVQNVDNTDVAVADYNRDGILDFVAAADAESKFGVALGLGDGTFRLARVITDPMQQRGWTLTPGDFNRDGRADVGIGHGYCCVGGNGVPGAFGVMLGLGDGTFGAISRHMVPSNGRVQLATIDPAVADFNGDGKPDVAASFYNNVGGTTRGTIILTNTSGTSPRSPALGTLSVQPTSLLGGGTVAEVNIQLAAGAVAPSGGLTFTASNTNPSVAFLPFSQTSPPMLMAAGMTNLRFKVETKPVTTTQTVTVTVRHSSLGSRSVNLTVTPPSEPLALDSLKVSTGTYGGNDAGGEVSLNTGHVAPPGGVIVTLTNDNPSLITSMPASVTIPGGQSTAGFTVQTWTTPTTTPVNFTASYNGVTKSAVMHVHAPTQNVPISSVTLSPSSVVGGSNQAVQATITLAANAPSEGATIMLSSSRPEVVSLPRSVRIFFSTQNTAYVNFIANPVSTPTEVTITAYFGDSVQSAVVTVTPPAANTPVLSSLTLNPSSVSGGSSSQGTVTISAASQTPTTVSLTSSSAPIVSVPASVTIPAGATSAGFTVNTTSVSSSFTATIGATLNGLSRNATLTVTPAGDTVAIQRAEYDSGNRTLRVEATSTRTNATLQVLVTSTGQIIGTLANNGGGKYGAQLNWSVNPQNITVRSSFGGSATRSVTLK
jgi:FG-GAP-like repeat